MGTLFILKASEQNFPVLGDVVYSFTTLGTRGLGDGDNKSEAEERHHTAYPTAYYIPQPSTIDQGFSRAFHYNGAWGDCGAVNRHLSGAVSPLGLPVLGVNAETATPQPQAASQGSTRGRREKNV